MAQPFDLDKFKALAKLDNRYERQLGRLHDQHLATGAIEQAVEGAVQNLALDGAASLVIYGDPQSGKTEMMICLTARLLDEGHSVIVHLLNDSVDLLSQSLTRFKGSGLAPAPRSHAELAQGTGVSGEQVIFCKKNARDLQKLTNVLQNAGIDAVVVIDDEADYATPNGRINKGEVTKINELVGDLLRPNGFYVGVTATPARLDLNNTFNNDTERWVQFHPHDKYTGQKTFFPLDLTDIEYRLTLIATPGEKTTRDALVRFLATSAYLNEYVHNPERNWTMLVHTSGKKADHKVDRDIVEGFVNDLLDPTSPGFASIVEQVHASAQVLYPEADADKITGYVVQNASRATTIVLNSERDRKALGDNVTDPTSPFTIIIGGNIVSRGVTFPNLLSMYFTRNVKSKLQQDTYIQRARMFGARGEYLKYFELTIPTDLFMDWHKCFVFHSLALDTISSDMGAPVWLGDKRVSVASSASIDRSTVVLDKGEMSYKLFDFDASLDTLVAAAPTDVATLSAIQALVGQEALPQFLIEFITTVRPSGDASLAIHLSSSIAGYKDTSNPADFDREKIVRRRGFIGRNQLESAKFPKAVHHIKIFRNEAGKARVFYKFVLGVQFMQNLG